MTLKKTLKGTITALITPFLNQEVDEEGWMRNIHYQMAQGIDGLLLFGSTGESPTLSPEEQTRLLSLTVKEVNGKVPIWVGTGSYCTKQTIERTKRAHDLGADIALVVTPYYNRPTQEGIFRHCEAIATQSKLPIVLYNNGSRCGVNIETSTLLRIAELPNIAGVKDASGSVSQVGDVIQHISSKYPHFSVFSGDDILTLPMMVLGATGVISIASNLIPSKVIALVNAALQGRFDLAQKMHYELLPFFKSVFIETNPIPIKTAMDLCGMAAGECRLPLYKMAPQNIVTIRQVLAQMGLVT